MDAKEVVLTYETLYEIARREKSREELQQIDEDFYQRVLFYLKEKQAKYDESMMKNDVFSQSEREKLHIQLHNIRRILKDLYDNRERKIITMAINKSRTQTNIIDTSTLLPEEQALYSRLTETMEHYRQGVLHHVTSLREPVVMGGSPVKTSVEPTPVQAAEPTPIQTPAEAPSEPAPVQTEAVQEAPNSKNIKFIDDTEEFAGEDLELYGPFKANDLAELPSEVADLLINQGKAVEQ